MNSCPSQDYRGVTGDRVGLGVAGAAVGTKVGAVVQPWGTSQSPSQGTQPGHVIGWSDDFLLSFYVFFGGG